MTDVRWLNPAEDRAWRGYRQMRRLLDLQLARDLTADSGLSEPDYDVLSTLSEAPARRLRLVELARWLLWSKSRLSHHVTRMERRGLVRRELAPADGRGAYVALTEAGLRTIVDAAPGHVDAVRRHFVDLFSDAEINMLAAVTTRVVDHLSGIIDAAPRGTMRTSTSDAALPH
jgi:DNA-binding MarR family transcriptional regulator